MSKYELLEKLEAQSHERWEQAYRERWQQWPRWKRLLFWWNNPRVLDR